MFHFGFIERGISHYRHYMSQQPLEDLVLPVAQVAVCVQRVLLAVKMQLYHVVFVLYFLLSRKGYLGGCPTEIKRSHCGPARAEPVPHKTILQRSKKGGRSRGSWIIHAQ